MKEKFEQPVFEVVEFDTEDVIAVSDPPTTPIAPDN